MTTPASAKSATQSGCRPGPPRARRVREAGTAHQGAGRDRRRPRRRRRRCATWPGSPRPTSRSSRSRPTPTTAAASSGTRPRTCWRRPCSRSSPRPSSASARRSRTASTTTSTSSEPFTPEDLKAIEKAMERIIKPGQRFVAPRRHRRRGARRARRRAVQARADRAQGRRVPTTATRVVEVGGGELTIYDNVDPQHRRDASGRTCAAARTCRPPGTSHGVQAHPHRRRLLARHREEPAAAAHLRHRLGPPRTSCDAYLERSPRPSKRDHRKLGAELDLFSFPDEIGSGLAVFHPKGGIIRKEMEDYSRAAAHRGRLRVRQHPAHHQGPAVRDLRPPRLVPRRHVPADAPRRGARRGRQRHASRARTTTSSR